MEKFDGRVYRGTDADDFFVGTDRDDIFFTLRGRGTVKGGAGYDTMYVDYRGIDAHSVNGTFYSDISVFKDGFNGRIAGPTDDHINAVQFKQVESINLRLSAANDFVRIGGRALGSERLVIDGGGGIDTLGIGTHVLGRGSIAIFRSDGHVESNLGVFRGFERVILEGGNEADLFGGGVLDDAFYGAGGSDTVTYQYATAGVTIQLKDGDVDTIGAGTDEFKSIENLIGSRFDDVLTGLSEGYHGGRNALSGGAGDDTLSGLGGKDVLGGGAGDDVLKGGDAADVLSGGAGHDVLVGGVARDVLIGGTGADRLEGGLGADTFRYGAEDLTAAIDRIVDFSTAQGDRIDLSGIDADAATDGDQAFAFLGTAAFTGAGGSSGELRFEAAADGFLLIQGDVNHDAVADFSVLVRTATLAAADFML